MRTFLLASFVSLLFLTPLALAQRADVAGLNLKVDDEGGFRVTYKGVVVIPRGSFYLADKDWKSAFPAPGAKAFRVLSTPTAGGQTIRLATAPQEFVDATLEATVEARRLALDLRYKTKPNTSAHFAVCDIFLSKELFSGSAFRVHGADAASQEGILDEKAFKGLTAPSVALRSILGAVTLTMKAERVPSDAGAASAWTLRNVCDRPWGPEELRTFSLLNCFTGVPVAGLEQRLSFTIAIEEAADLDARLYASNLERSLSAFKLAYQKLGGDPAGLEGQLQALQPEARVEFLSEAILKLKRASQRVLIIPAPQEMTVTAEGFTFDMAAAIVAGHADPRASNLLREELRESFGLDVPIERPEQKSKPRAIAIGEPTSNPLVAQLCRELGVQVSPQNPGPQGYVLVVKPNAILVAGSDPRGTFYGIQSLIQLLRRDADGKVVATGLSIRDWPAMEWRGIHIWGASREAPVDDLKRVIRRVGARYKMNVFMFGHAFTDFQWRSHPEITPQGRGMTMDQLKEIADYAREHFLEPIPAFQSFGHLEHLFRSHPEIAEDAKRFNSYCPSNPKSYELIFDLFGEAIAAFQPKYFHIGHDEIQGIGTCEKCCTKPHHQLLAEDITRIRDWLHTRGVRAILWGDMLLDAKQWASTGIGAHNSNSGHYGAKDTHLALDLIPKDVIIADWHYEGVKEFPTLAHFKAHGFEAFAAPWYNAANNFYFAQAAHEAKALGVVVTDWGFLGTLSAAATSILGPEYAWTPGRPALDELPYSPSEVLAAQLRPRRPSDKPGARHFSVDLARFFNQRTTAADGRDWASWFGEGRGRDLSLLPAGELALGSIAFRVAPAVSPEAKNCLMVGGKDLAGQLPTEVKGIPVGRRAASLLFLHTMTCDNPGLGHQPTARYRIEFADGSSVAADAKENLHITHWKTYEPRKNPWHWREGYADLYGAKCAWRGFTRFGDDVNLQAFEWVNPEPAKKIKSFDLSVLRHSERLRVALLAVTGVEP